MFRPNHDCHRRQRIENGLLCLLALAISVFGVLMVMYKLGRIELATVEAGSVFCGLVGASGWLWIGLRA
jgi:hypothetical protein